MLSKPLSNKNGSHNLLSVDGVEERHTGHSTSKPTKNHTAGKNAEQQVLQRGGDSGNGGLSHLGDDAGGENGQSGGNCQILLLLRRAAR